MIPFVAWEGVAAVSNWCGTFVFDPGQIAGKNAIPIHSRVIVSPDSLSAEELHKDAMGNESWRPADSKIREAIISAAIHSLAMERSKER